MEKKKRNWLLIIFLATLFLRLTLAFMTPNFTYESYFHLRQVEHITETGLPIYDDNLSYSGRTFQFLPFFHYLIAFFNLFLPLELAAKIIPNILLASLTIIVYLISKKITKNETASFLSAFVAGFLPILFSTNSFGPETLFLPLTFLTIYTFFNIRKKIYLYWYVLLFLILSLTSSATFLLIMGFGIYLLLAVIEKKEIDREEIEVILFSVFFFVWIQFLFFKNLFIEKGISFIWQNVPPQIIQEYFPTVSVAQALILVSIIPFLVGVFVVYRSLFQLKNERSFLLISFAVSTTLLTWSRLIEFKLSLAFFSIILAILFAPFYQDLKIFIKKTRVSHWANYLPIILIGLLALTMIFPAVKVSLEQETPTNSEIAAFRWLKENTPENSRVLALLEEGHLITYYGKRKNIIDNKFASIKDIEERFSDSNSLFTTKFQTQASDLIDKYNLDYIMFTTKAKEKYQQSNFKYLSINCFERVYKDDTKIYRVKCSLNEIENEKN